MANNANLSEHLAQAATREHLLEAAGRVFSEAGFKAATVREICESAGANIASVNYHFGDKEALYRAVLKSSHQAALAQFPPKESLNPALPPPKRLRMFVKSFLLKIFSEGPAARHGKLMAREMIEPSSALEDIVREEIRPMSEDLRAIVSEIMGEKADAKSVRLCCMGVVSQVLFYHHCRPCVSILMPEMRFNDDAIDDLAEHITRFSLAGMRECSRKQGKH